MTKIPKASELRHLSVLERLELMDEIWASLAAEQEAISLPDWHFAENRCRLAARGSLKGIDTTVPREPDRV